MSTPDVSVERTTATELRKHFISRRGLLGITYSHFERSHTMNILMTECSLNWGGQEQRMLREALWLEARGHKVTIACQADSALAERLAEMDIPWRLMTFDAFDAPALAWLAKETKADIIHTRRSKDTTCALPARLRGAVVVRSRHMTMEPLRPAQRWLYRWGSNRLIAASRHIKEGIVLAGVRADKIDVIGEGVDFEEFHPGIDGSSLRREWHVPAGAPLFGVIGMFRSEKGQSVFVRAARKLLHHAPHARFVLVGDGPHHGYAEKLRQRIAASFPGLEAPLFVAGFRRDIPRVTAALDALVVPSLREAQTLVIPQAFAMRKPVIASNVGGIPELVQHGVNGLLVPPDDPGALSHAMRLLLDDQPLAQRLADEGYRFAHQHLSFDEKGRQLVRTYEMALGRASSSFCRRKRKAAPCLNTMR